MKNVSKHLLLFLVVLLPMLTPITVSAHPGRTDENGCHTCRTNCENWGLEYGEYHCHNNGTSSSRSNMGNSTYSNVEKDEKTTGSQPRTTAATQKVVSSSFDSREKSEGNTNNTIMKYMEYGVAAIVLVVIGGMFIYSGYLKIKEWLRKI